LRGVVSELLAKSPEDRPRDAKAVIAAIDGVSERGPDPTETNELAMSEDELRTIALMVFAPRTALTSEVARDVVETLTLHGAGTIHHLVDGSIAAVFEGKADPGELAAEAARCSSILAERHRGTAAIVTTSTRRRHEVLPEEALR